MPSGPASWNTTGRLEKYLDVDQSPGCTVIYADPVTASEWRPQFQNQQDPYQHDRSHQNRLDLARQHMGNLLQSRRLMPDTRDLAGKTALGHCHGEEEWTEALEVAAESRNFFGKSCRSLSSPSLTHKPFFCKADGKTMSCLRWAPGTQEMEHLPGYRGYIPGYLAETTSVMKRFSHATHACATQKKDERAMFQSLTKFGGPHLGHTTFKGVPKFGALEFGRSMERRPSTAP